ncbi:hypothetical protein SAMN05421819_4575 [Bryocella elongata]|uniref:Trypsin-like peptidase domain-containing protein n=1 Tax=Bryocella elongata TaxID=863522 RepID=A0A1H6CHX3_9BACT|nr:hypothetical protein SAMN05421819_4575 [Bryocella elongata]
MQERMSLGEVRSILKGTTDQPSDEWNGIIRDATSNTVVIVAISRSSGGSERIQQAGTGTLVFLDGAHYILTATHVWDSILVHADRLGATIRTGRGQPNTFSIDIRAMSAPIAFPREQGCEQWGPDLALLRIPDFCVGTIEAFRPFFDLHAISKVVPRGNDSIETWILCGVPAVLGTSSETAAHAHGRAFQVEVESVHNRNGFDYIDVLAHWPSTSVAPHFGGVSGGGLWKLSLYVDPLAGRIDCIRTLEGVAFYQFPFRKEHSVLRCHGPNSLRLVSANCAERSCDLPPAFLPFITGDSLHC